MTTSATTPAQFEIFLAAAPGHETPLAEEARERNFGKVRVVPGGVSLRGGWREVWRANLQLRGAGRVLARIATFRAAHLSELERRARAVAWSAVLRPGVPFRVEATSSRSRIYHSGAAAEWVERAVSAALGAAASAGAEVIIKVRIEDDTVTLAVDTSGEPLHKRGFKAEVAKAPLRETLAAMVLRQCGWCGNEPLLDPMCGSGTLPIEAAEIAAGLMPGRARHFAFEKLATFDADAFERLKQVRAPAIPGVRIYGNDRDPGAIRMSRANAERAGVAQFMALEERDIAEILPPAGPPGLVVVNPPYGARIGEARHLAPLYRTLGTSLRRFTGWRVGLLTSERSLAAATGLAFKPPPPPILHGGLRVGLYLTDTLR